MQRILSYMRRAIEQYNMIENDDRIAVGVSGGKDSLTLLKGLVMLKRFYPKKFELEAIIVDVFNGSEDFTKVSNFCEELGVTLSVVTTDINKIVFVDRKEKNPCSLCSKMRRGCLNTKALELGCNKIALGHHSGDMVETMLLSLCYEGRLSTFHPVSYMSKTGLTVIRPLILAPEKLIKTVSSDFPILTNPCPANHNTKREYMRNKLKELGNDIPHLEVNLLSAIISPERYNMLDKMDEKNLGKKRIRNRQKSDIKK